ncbi:MAG: flavodoxin, partial [Oscillospiraceae bacterium]|nr:flavodoxin [Oscillospiraceae bacterium]
MKSLVAYFSAGGVTAEVARVIAEAAGAELFAITPEPPYSEQDIRWTNP